MCKHRWEENWKGQEFCEKCGQFKNDRRYQAPEPKEVDFDEVADFLMGSLTELHAWTSPATIKASRKKEALRQALGKF
jgi:hypothetical protein